MHTTLKEHISDFLPQYDTYLNFFRTVWTQKSNLFQPALSHINMWSYVTHSPTGPTCPTGLLMVEKSYSYSYICGDTFGLHQNVKTPPPHTVA